MSRSFTASSLVRLPRLSAISAARLLQELLHAAKAEKKIPAALVPDVDDLSLAYDALHGELAKRLAGEETPQVRASDLVEDNAFGALVDWLRAFARLPEGQYPEATSASAVLGEVFPEGLSFLAIAPENEWQEAEIRLNLIADRGHDDTIKKLGGGPFLHALKAAHKAYGEALGITSVKSSAGSPAVREALDAAVDAIRAYVLRASAHARKNDPQSAALAERLLAPIASFKDRSPRAPAAAPPAAPPAPEVPAVGTP